MMYNIYTDCHTEIIHIQGGPKNGPSLKVHNYDGRRSIHQNVQLFIRSKAGILAVVIFTYSLHMFKQTTLHRKYQLI